MKLPISLRPDPYRKGHLPSPLGPPSFRTAIHRPLDQSDPRRPPSFETGFRETLIDRPGYLVEASDRAYVTTPEGSLRRATAVSARARYRKPPTKAQARQQAKAQERIEAELDRQERRRAKRAARILRGARPINEAKERRESSSGATGKDFHLGVMDDPYEEASLR